MIRGLYFKTLEFNSMEADQYANWPTFSHIVPFKVPSITEFRTTDTILHQQGHSYMDISKQNDTHTAVFQLLQKTLRVIAQDLAASSGRQVGQKWSLWTVSSQESFSSSYHTVGKGMLNLTAKADKLLAVVDWSPQSPDLNVNREEILDYLDEDVKDSLILKMNSQNC